MKTYKHLSFRCQAFTGQPLHDNLMAVSPDGTIRVWDSVADHYTTCHNLTATEQAEIRRLANERGVIGDHQ